MSQVDGKGEKGMDLKQLEYFQCICEEGSISKAAERLYISQQGVSKAIASLEKELDCQLLERTTKGVRLTAAGQTLQKGAKRLLKDRDILLAEMQEFKQSETLSVSMVIGSRFSLRPRFFDLFLERHPGLRLEIEELENEECIYNLEHGRADVILVHEMEQTKDCVSQLFKEEILTVIMPKDHPLANRKELSLADLQGLTIVCHQGNSSTFVVEKCRERKITFEREIQVPGILALYQTCANMRVPGLSLESINGKFTFDNLVSIPIRREEISWKIDAVYRGSAVSRRIVQDFVSFLLEEGAGDPIKQK